LTPTVGTLDVGIMDLTTFLLLSTENSKIGENQIAFGTINFHPQ
jgi:hypothetical protein